MASEMSSRLNADRPLLIRRASLAKSRVWRMKRDVCRKKSEGKTTGLRTMRPCCVVLVRNVNKKDARPKCPNNRPFAVSKS